MISNRILKTAAMFLALAFFCTSFALPAKADETAFDASSWLEAKNRGPILWYVRDEDKRAAMEADLELLRLHNEAYKARKRRRIIGDSLFWPGAVILTAGGLAGIFQHAIGSYDEETGEAIMVAGVGVGLGLIIPGIIFKAKESKAEKTYHDYVRDKYKIIPILQKEPNGEQRYAIAFSGQF